MWITKATPYLHLTLHKKTTCSYVCITWYGKVSSLSVPTQIHYAFKMGTCQIKLFSVNMV